MDINLYRRLTELERLLKNSGKKFGFVTQNEDPEKKGRIKAVVKSVTGDFETEWAYPCTLYAGNEYGVLFIPEIGDRVMIEFVDNNTNNPVYSGQFWDVNIENSGQVVPSDIPTVGKIIKTKEGHSIKFDEKNIEIKEKNGALINVANDKIDIKFSDSVNLEFKDGKLIVTADNIEFDGNVTINQNPLPLKGFCTIPNCLFTGAPHNTNMSPK